VNKIQPCEYTFPVQDFKSGPAEASLACIHERSSCTWKGSKCTRRSPMQALCFFISPSLRATSLSFQAFSVSFVAPKHRGSIFCQYMASNAKLCDAAYMIQKISALLAVLHEANEPLCIAHLSSSDCGIFTLDHCSEKALQATFVHLCPVIETRGPVLGFCNKKPPRRCIGKFDRGCVTELSIQHTDDMIHLIHYHVFGS
jgi:hypothetical protein